MAREVVYKWACSACDKQYPSKEAAEECENLHPQDGEIVGSEGFRRHHGSTARDVWIRWSSGEEVKYRRVPQKPDNGDTNEVTIEEEIEF